MSGSAPGPGRLDRDHAPSTPSLRLAPGTVDAHCHLPDDGALVDHVPRTAPTAGLQHELLVDDPERPYW